MDIIGFPDSSIAVEICNHRYGSIAGIGFCTDTANLNSRYVGEMFACKHNIGRVTIFDNPYDSNSNYDRAEARLCGKTDYEIYFPTDRWFRNGAVELIPDYSALAWTSAGAAVFAGAVEGVEKAYNYPNHGQEMFNVSGGLYGYDFVGDTPGTNNLAELYSMVEILKTWYYNIFGVMPIGVSYRNGKTGCSQLLIPKFIFGRTSSYSYAGDSRTAYGLSKINGEHLGLPDNFDFNRVAGLQESLSTRTWDAIYTAGLTETQSREYTTGEIAKAILHKGIALDFMHLHDAARAPENLNFIDNIYGDWDAQIGENFVHRASFGELMAYKFLRDSIKRISGYEHNGKVIITAEVGDPYKSQQYEGMSTDLIMALLRTPISFKIDISGTSLAGSEISSDCVGIRKISTNVYVVDVNLSNAKDGFMSVQLSATASPSYYDFSRPVISSCTNTGGILSITSNIPARLALFWTVRGGEPKTSRLLCRSNVLGTSHSINLNDSAVRNYYNNGSDPKTLNEILSGDIYIGAITDRSQSTLSSVYQLL